MSTNYTNNYSAYPVMDYVSSILPGGGGGGSGFSGEGGSGAAGQIRITYTA